MNRTEALQALEQKVRAGEKYATMGHTLLCSRAFPSDDCGRHSPAQLAVNVWNQGELRWAEMLHAALAPEWAVELDGSRVFVSKDEARIVRDLPNGLTSHAWLLALIAIQLHEKADA